jgi:hypothetical protein
MTSALRLVRDICSEISSPEWETSSCFASHAASIAALLRTCQENKKSQKLKLTSRLPGSWLSVFASESRQRSTSLDLPLSVCLSVCLSVSPQQALLRHTTLSESTLSYLCSEGTTCECFSEPHSEQRYASVDSLRVECLGTTFECFSGPHSFDLALLLALLLLLLLRNHP